MPSSLSLDRFRQVLGPKGVITDPAEIAPWLNDWRGRYHGESPAILAPATTQEVAAVVGIAREAGIALVPQGGNTSMVGGATPPADGSALILSLRRMNRIRSISADANQAVCEAGVILATLHDAAAAVGRRFPLSLGAKGSATVGGLISTNAGGTQVLRHGTMRALVAGLEAVLPDGTVYDGLSPLKKDNRGYDLRQLLIGAEGTLGVVTAATLKLAPAIARSATAWVGVRSPQDALTLLYALQQRLGPIVEGFEIISGEFLDMVLRHIAGTRSPIGTPAPWHALLEFDLTAEGDRGIERIETLLAEFLGLPGVVDVAIAQNEAQAAAFWRIRESVSEAARTESPTLPYDVSVPVERMPDFMLETAQAVRARFPGTDASAFGHLGDGNVHFHVHPAPGSEEGLRWVTGHYPEVSTFVHDAVVAAGGSISAEHGIGQMKRAELGRLTPPGQIAALRAIKQALDPAGIMNPGKLIPLASEG